MKKNILIILFLIAAISGAFTLKANSQIPQKAEVKQFDNYQKYDLLARYSGGLLADETTITYTKTMAKIECCNESIAKAILQKWEQLITRYNCTRKKDRNGVYKQYNIYLNKDDAQYILKWAKTNL